MNMKMKTKKQQQQISEIFVYYEFIFSAYLGGVKGNYATIGVTASVALNDCRGQNNTAYHVDSIAKWAQDYGMSTGKHLFTDCKKTKKMKKQKG